MSRCKPILVLYHIEGWTREKFLLSCIYGIAKSLAATALMLALGSLEERILNSYEHRKSYKIAAWRFTCALNREFSVSQKANEGFNNRKRIVRLLNHGTSAFFETLLWFTHTLLPRSSRVSHIHIFDTVGVLGVLDAPPAHRSIMMMMYYITGISRRTRTAVCTCSWM